MTASGMRCDVHAFAPVSMTMPAATGVTQARTFGITVHRDQALVTDADAAVHAAGPAVDVRRKVRIPSASKTVATVSPR